MNKTKQTTLYRSLKFKKYLGYKVGTDGSVWTKKKTGIWRKLSPGKGKYSTVCLYNKKGCKTYYVHELVLEAFIGPRPVGKEARHFPDRDTSNNNVWNLSWSSRSRNMRDKIVHGTDNRGEKNNLACFSNKQVQKIRRIYATGKHTFVELASRYGVSEATIRNVVKRDTYSSVE